MIITSYLDKHISLIEKSNINNMINTEGESYKKNYILYNSKRIDSVLSNYYDIWKVHFSMSKIMQRYFVCVQEKQLDISDISGPIWHMMINDEKYRHYIFNKTERYLKSISKYLCLSEVQNIYGGIKSIESIRRKIKEKRLIDNTEVILQNWDLVRFRIVVKSLYSLRKLCVLLWMNNFDDILRCRNYYFQPRAGNISDPYKSIHFLMKIGKFGIFELQVMSVNREITSLFDQEFTFKKEIEFINNDHEKWLRNFQMCSNILDWQDNNLQMSVKH